MMISVTAEHITKGVAHKCEFCPVALALKDATGIEWTVGLIGALSVNGGKCYEIELLPLKVRIFILDFDKGEHVDPFEFDLPIDSH